MRILFAGLMTIVFATAVQPGVAKADPLSGKWRGGGIVKPADGARERARCRFTYSKRGGKSYGVVASCSTPSLGAVRQTATITRLTKNRYRGSFHNTQYNVTGSIRVIVRGRRHTVYLSSSAGTGTLHMRR